MKIQNISDDEMRNLIKNIQNGNTRLVLVKNDKLHNIYTEEEKQQQIDDVKEFLEEPAIALVPTIIGNVAMPATEAEKMAVAKEKMRKIRKLKALILSTDCEKDDIEDVKIDFAEAINNITNSKKYNDDIYDSSIDIYLTEEYNKIRYKK